MQHCSKTSSMRLGAFYLPHQTYFVTNQVANRFERGWWNAQNSFPVLLAGISSDYCQLLLRCWEEKTTRSNREKLRLPFCIIVAKRVARFLLPVLSNWKAIMTTSQVVSTHLLPCCSFWISYTFPFIVSFSPVFFACIYSSLLYLPVGAHVIVMFGWQVDVILKSRSNHNLIVIKNVEKSFDTCFFFFLLCFSWPKSTAPGSLK